MNPKEQVKTSEILYETPEDFNNVSLVSNDKDTPGCVSNPPGCTDWLAAVEQLKLEQQEYNKQLELEFELKLLEIEKQLQLELEKLELEKMERLQKMESPEADADFPGEEFSSCEAVGDQDDQDEESLDEQRGAKECAEADAEEHDEVRNDDEDPEEECDHKIHGSEEEEKDFSAIDEGFRVFSRNFESTKEDIAKADKFLKELRRDVNEELENELDDKFRELQVHKDYIKGVCELECYRIKRLQTFVESYELDVDWPRGQEKPKVRVQLPKEFRARVRQILNELDEVVSALLVRDESLAIHKTQNEAAWLFACIRKATEMMTIRLTLEKEIKNLGSLDTQEGDFVSSLTLEKEIKDLERTKLRESLNTQEDDLVSTLGHLRHRHGEGDVPARIINPPREMLECYEDQLPPETLDQKRILALKGSVEWSAASLATENAWVRRASPSFSNNNGKESIPDNAEAENINENRNVSLESNEEWSNDIPVPVEARVSLLEKHKTPRAMPPERDKILDALKIETDVVKLFQGIRRWLSVIISPASRNRHNASLAQVGAEVQSRQTCLTPRFEVGLSWIKYSTERCPVRFGHSERLRNLQQYSQEGAALPSQKQPQTEIYNSRIPNPRDAERSRSQTS